MKLKIRNIEITLSYLLICALAVCIITGVLSGLLFCAIAVFIHELGHFAFLARYHCKPQRIDISLFKISFIEKNRCKMNDKQNFLVLFAGPAFNFICFILFYLLYLLYNIKTDKFAFVNFYMGFFNMLPVMSLDGGQILYLLLCKKYSESTAENTVNIITFICIFPIAALGFLLLFNSKYNFSLLLLSAYLMVSLIIKDNSFY